MNVNLRGFPQSLQDVANEMSRVRQEEGYSLSHDVNQVAELVQAGVAYSTFAHSQEYFPNMEWSAQDAGWPPLWKPDSWKPKSFRRNLIRAAALILFAVEAYDERQRRRKGSNVRVD